MTEKTSQIWDLTVRGSFRYRTCFEKDVTLKEAINLFNSGEYEDVTDTEEYEVWAEDGS